MNQRDQIHLSAQFELARERKAQRVEMGADPVVAGWQCFLEELLIRMDPYLRQGHIITFQQLQPPEQRVFEDLHQVLSLPRGVRAVYIPPSVLQGMLRDPHATTAAQQMLATMPQQTVDAGIILASGSYPFARIVNSLLAVAPWTPGTDVYEDGRLLAGYNYPSIEACIGDLGQVLHTYLDREDGSESFQV